MFFSMIKIWDYQTKACVATLEGHTNNVSAVFIILNFWNSSNRFEGLVPPYITCDSFGLWRWHGTSKPKFHHLSPNVVFIAVYVSGSYMACSYLSMGEHTQLWHGARYSIQSFWFIWLFLIISLTFLLVWGISCLRGGNKVHMPPEKLRIIIIIRLHLLTMKALLWWNLVIKTYFCAIGNKPKIIYKIVLVFYN